MWVQITLVVVLMLVNAGLAGSEMAFVSLRESQVNRLAEEAGERGQRLARLVADPNRYLSTIQVGITVSGFLASATAAVALAQPLVEPLSRWFGEFAQPAAVFILTVVLSYLTLVLGELAPKRIAIQKAQGWALTAAGPVSVLASVTHPLVWLLAKSTEAVVRVFGLDPHAGREEVTEEEIRDMIAAQESMPAEQRSIIEGALDLDERRLWQILVPRSEVLFLPSSDETAPARRKLIEAGLSRAPVTGDDEDDVVGVVHLRSLVDAPGTVGDYVRPAIVLPDSVGVLQALGRMKKERGQLALVVDEFGSIAGIVTLEDVLEEIVGEIYDEYDRDAAAVVHGQDGSMELPGSFPAHDLGDFGVEIEPGRHATIAGIVLEQFGDIPTVGETTRIEGWNATVLERTDRAILRVRLTPVIEDQEGAAAEAAEEPRELSGDGMTPLPRPASPPVEVPRRGDGAAPDATLP
jgi:putative hemolysin